MRGRRILLIVGLLLMLGLLAACGGRATPEPTEAPKAEPTKPPARPQAGPLGAVELGPGDPIKIASLQAISGAVASLGTDQVRGIEIAIDDRGGEIKGHPIELQNEDDLCNSEGGTTGAQKIVSDPQVIGIVGTSCSGAGVPASRIMSEAGLVMVSGSNTSPFLTSLGGEKGNAWQPGYFRTAHNDEVQGRAAATFVYDVLGFTKAASIHDGDPYTQGLVMVFNQVFEELGGEIVEATAVNKGDTDMRPVLTSIAAKGPELIYFPIFQPEGDFIAIQAKELPELADVILMGADGLLSDTYVVIPDTKDMYFSGPATPGGAAYEALVAKYEAKYGEAPIQAFHAHAYDAANMLFAAIEEVAVELPDGGLFIDRQALRDALYATKDFPGLTGTLTCNEFGDCASPSIDIVRNDDPAAGIAGTRANVVSTYVPGVGMTGAAAMPAPEKPFRVGFVTDTGGIDDKSFNTTQWNGVQRAATELGVEAQFIQSDEATQYEPNLTEFASQGYDLVIAAGFFLGGDTAKVAAQYPDVQFSIVDYTYPDPFGVPEGVVGHSECVPNVQGQIFRTDQAAFLAGYLAAGMTKTGKIGYFGGAKIPTVTYFGVGFQTGMEHYNQVHGTDVQLLGWDNETGEGLHTGDFMDLTKGKEATESLFDEGVDIFIPVGGLIGAPGFDVARERGGLGIWVDVDGYNLLPEARDVLLTSVMKNMDNSVFDVIKATKEGNFQGCGVYIGDLANGGVGIAPYHDLEGAVPDDLKAEVEELRQKIISGEISDTGCISYPEHCPGGLY